MFSNDDPLVLAARFTVPPELPSGPGVHLLAVVGLRQDADILIITPPGRYQNTDVVRGFAWVVRDNFFEGPLPVAVQLDQGDGTPMYWSDQEKCTLTTYPERLPLLPQAAIAGIFANYLEEIYGALSSQLRQTVGEA